MVYPRKIPPPTLVKLRCLENPMLEEMPEHPDDRPPDRDRPQRRNGHVARHVSLIYTGNEAIGVYVGPLDKHGLPLTVPCFVPATSNKAECVIHPGWRGNLTLDSPLLHILRSSRMFRAPTHWEDHPEEN
jgi:hypothetical protein